MPVREQEPAPGRGAGRPGGSPLDHSAVGEGRSTGPWENPPDVSGQRRLLSLRNGPALGPLLSLVIGWEQPRGQMEGADGFQREAAEALGQLLLFTVQSM